ncbi:TIM barrel protein [Bacteroides ihuae]|uniref:TIM barrel protein n=1 Tax=Bacteroides ihuae TaxID=1852362 RepID=UPI000A8FBBE6|nr:TIM barrel protein [Bacteroides ihuae]
MLSKCTLLLMLYLSSTFSLEVEANTLKNEKDGQRYKIAVCDWMIMKRQKIGSFELVNELKGDGVEMDMGGLGKRDSFDNKLRQPSFQKLFREKSKEYNVSVSSVAMSGFYGQSFVARPNYKDLVKDCLNTMKVMDVKVAFLPLGVQCDLNKYPEIRQELVYRLKIVGDMALKEGRIIGVETSLDAKGEVALLKDINSKGIKIYYKFQNSLEAGRNLCDELRILGKDNICQIHCTDTDGTLLADNKRLDMNKVKRTLDDMGWSGWLVVERSRDANNVHDVKANYGGNISYLKSIFQKKDRI